MAAFYLDHNVPLEVASYLRTTGHDVRTTRDIRKERASDDEQLIIAFQAGRILITQNADDFILLHRAWYRWSRLWSLEIDHPGILVLESGRSARQLATAIESLIDSGEKIQGRLFAWTKSRSWTELERG